MKIKFQAALTAAPLIILLSALFFSGIFYESYQLPKAFSFIVLSLFFAPLSALFRGEKGFKAPEIFMALYYLFMSAYSLFSPHHPPFFYSASAFAPAAFFVFYYSPVRPRAFTAFVSLLLFASFFYAVVQSAQRGIERPFSFFGNPVFAAEFAGALIPFSIAGVFLAGREKSLHYAVLLFFIPAMVLYSSRGAALGAAVSVLSLVFMQRKWIFKSAAFTKKTAAGLLITAAVLLALPGFTGSLKNFFSRSASALDLSSPEVSNRAVMAKAAVSMWKESPVFGKGSGAYGALFQKEQARFLSPGSAHSFIKTGHTHNDYLQLLAETGIAGLALFLFALFACIYRFEKNAPYMNEKRYLITSAALSSVIFICISSFFSFPLFSMPSCILLFAACGLACASPQVENTPRHGPYAVTAAVILAVPLILLCFFGFHKKIPADSYAKYALNSPLPEAWFSRSLSLDPSGFHALYHYGAHKSSAGDFDGALAVLKSSLSYHPYSADTLYNCGALLAASGNHAEAMQYFNRALALYPAFKEANDAAFHSLSSMGREEEALKYLEPAALSGSLSDSRQKAGIILMEAPFEEK